MSLRSCRSLALGAAICAVLASAGVTAAEDARRARIHFLDIEEAAKTIAGDEGGPYFSLLQPLEMSAKTGTPIRGEGLAGKREECRRRYRQAVLEFTVREKETVRWAIWEIQPYLEQRYPRLAKTAWRFVKVNSHIEGGLPHTRGDAIVLSPRVLRRFIGSHKMRPRAEALDLVAGILLHEQFHVFQRQNRALFDSLYTEVWGFRRTESVELHPWLLRNQVINPDGPANQWIFPIREGEKTTWVLPTLILGGTRGVRRLLGVPSLTADLRMIALELEPTETGFRLVVGARNRPVFHRLADFEAYRREFPYSAAPFHPNEIAAEGFARLATSELRALTTGGQRERPEKQDPRTLVLQRWLDRNLR